jgi:ABC-type sugar transport system substrate-binding protein
MAAAAFAVLAAGCSVAGSSSAGNPGSSGAAASAPGGAGASALVKSAQAVTKAASSGIVYADNLDPGTDPGKVIDLTTWQGPTAGVKPPAAGSKTIALVASNAASSIELSVSQIKSIAKQVGLSAESFVADGTQKGQQSTFEAALAKKPAAIIDLAIADAVIVPQLREARQMGIPTIGLNVDPTVGAADGLDAYVSYGTSLVFAVNAYAVIAHSGGQAHVLVIDDKEFPNLAAGTERFKSILAECSGCKAYELDWTVNQSQNPSQVQALVGGALQAHPDVNYIAMPYNNSALTIAGMLASQGKAGKVNIVTKDQDADVLKAVNAGSILYDTSFSSEWTSYAAVDQALRGITGTPYADRNKLGIGIKLFTAGNTPSDGDPTWNKYYDYIAKYDQLWGVKPS